MSEPQRSDENDRTEKARGESLSKGNCPKCAGPLAVRKLITAILHSCKKCGYSYGKAIPLKDGLA